MLSGMCGHHNRLSVRAATPMRRSPDPEAGSGFSLGTLLSVRGLRGVSHGADVVLLLEGALDHQSVIPYIHGRTGVVLLKPALPKPTFFVHESIVLTPVRRCLPGSYYSSRPGSYNET
jgi:hypothetical protein